MKAPSRPAVERVPPKAPYRIVNRVVRWALSSPWRAQRIGRHLLLLHFTGRKSGRRFVLPVAYRDAGDGRLRVLTNSGWRVNLRDDPHVTLTVLGKQRFARAHLVEDPDTVASVYRRLIDEVGFESAGRRMGIRINVPRTPTPAELGEAARRDGLAVIYLNVDGV